MSRRLNSWLPAFARKTSGHRNRRTFATFTCTPLESRLTPTNNFLGPLMQDQTEVVVRLGLDAYTPISAIPASPVGAVSYFDLENPRAYSIDSSRIQERLASASTVELAIPKPSGGFERFRVFEYQLLTPDFAAARPDIKTYRGVGL